MKAFLIRPALCWSLLTIGLWLLPFTPVASAQDYVPEILLKKMGGGRTLLSSDSALQVPTLHSLETAGFSVRFFDQMIGFTQHSESGILDREFGAHPPSPNLTSPYVFNPPVGPVWLPLDGEGYHDRDAQVHSTNSPSSVWDTEQVTGDLRNDLEIDEGTSATIEITLKTPPPVPDTLVITGYAGTILDVAPDTLIFTPQNTTFNLDLSQQFTLTAGHDADEEDTEITLTYTFSSGYSTTRKVLILDDDKPINLRPFVIDEGEARGLGLDLIDTPATDEVSFTITGHEGKFLDPHPTTLVFPPNSVNPVGLTLNALIDDNTVDDVVTLLFTGSGGGYDGVQYTMAVTIFDIPAYELLVPEGETRAITDLILHVSGVKSLPPNITSTWSGHEGTDLTIDPNPVPHDPLLYYRCDTYTYIDSFPIPLPRMCSPLGLLSFTAKEDNDDVDDQDILIIQVDVPRRTQSASRQINVRIEDDDDPGIIVEPSVLKIKEGEEATFKVKLSAPPSGTQPVTIVIPASVDDVTRRSSRTLTFDSDWDDFQEVTIYAEHDDDSEDEDPIPFWVQAHNSGFDRERGRVDVTIVDDDVPSIIVEPSDLQINEGDAKTFRIQLRTQPSASVTIPIPTVGDLEPDDDEVAFSATDWNIPYVITLEANHDDEDFEDDVEQIIFTASGGDYQGLTDTLDVTIIDDDLLNAGLTVDPEQLTLTEGGESKSFSVQLSEIPNGPVIVQISRQDETDLSVPSPPNLEFTTSDWDQAKTVSLSATHDVDGQDDSETVTLTANGGGYDGISITISITIEDDDTSAIDAPIAVTVHEGKTAPIAIRLKTEPSGDVTISIPSQGDITPDPTSITFTPTTWMNLETIILTAEHDDDSDDNPVTLELTGSEGGYDGITATVNVTIDDDDTPSLIVSPTSLNLSEGGESKPFDVRLQTQPSSSVEVSLSPSQSGLRLDKPTLTFTNSTWSQNQTVNVRALHDDNSNNETITIKLDAINYGENVTKSVVVNIADDDVVTALPQVNLSVTPSSVKEGSSLEIQVTLLETLTQDVEIPLTIVDQSTDSEDYGTLSNVRITTGDDEGTTTLSIIDDQVFEGKEYFILRFGDLPEEVRSGTSFSHRIEIIDSSLPPMVTLDPPSRVNEGEKVTIIVNLSDALPNPITVPLVITHRTASDLDYEVETETPLDVLFPAKSRQGTVQILAKTDRLVERLETFLVGVKTFSPPLVSEFPTPIEISIVDRTETGITAPSVLPVTEGIRESFPVALTAQPYDRVSLVITEGTGKLDITPTTLSFTSQDWNQPKPVELLSPDDEAIDQYPPVNVTLTANGGGYVNVIHPMTVQITDQSSPNLVVTPRSLTLEEQETESFEIRLNTQPSGPVTVRISPTHGQSYLESLTQSSLTFDASNFEDYQTVVVTAKKDNDSNDESETITISATGGGYSSAPLVTVDVNIIDIDPEIFIGDAEASEDNEMIQLPLSLSRPTSQVVTVQYSTEDASADADDDYVSSRGIVIFDPGGTQGVVQIEVKNDERNEDDESFVVSLSNSRNGTITDSTAIATILNDDGITSITIEDAVAGNHSSMITFTVRLSNPSSDAITVGYRTENGTATAGEDYSHETGRITFEPGTTEKTIDIPLLRQDIDWQQKTFFVHVESSEPARMEKSIATAIIQEETPSAVDVMTAYTSRFVRTASVHLTDALQQRMHPAGSSCSAMERAEMALLWHTTSRWTPSLGELLSGCRVSRDVEISGGSFGIWGRGAYRRFHGQNTNALTLRSNVSTAILGADYRWNAGWMAGMMVAHSQGNGDFRSTNVSGDIEAGLTGIYPYVSYEASGWEVWMSGGYGWGSTEVFDQSEDLTSRFGAVGFKGNLVLVQTSRWSYYGDVLFTDATVDQTRAEVIRVRLGMETDFQISEVIRPYVDVNVRQDAGDAEIGIGLEVGGGLRIAYPEWKLRGEVRSQGLLLHSADGFNEWGLSGSIQFGNPSEGLSMRVRPSWGMNHSMALYHQQTIRDVTPFQSGMSRTEVELGYGIPTKHGTVRSIATVTELPTGRLLRLGGEIRPVDWVSISVSGLAHHHQDTFGDVSLFVQSTLWN
ncbi:MAG: autotransporter domain-containing protein [Bacteroidetes bacterium]|nr:autotransporter domain-containing protein [Bacteroidota bacterium]